MQRKNLLLKDYWMKKMTKIGICEVCNRERELRSKKRNVCQSCYVYERQKERDSLFYSLPEKEQLSLLFDYAKEYLKNKK